MRVLFVNATLSTKSYFEMTTLPISWSFFINKTLFNFMKHFNNYGKVPFQQFDTSISIFLIVFFYVKCF